MSKPLPAQEIIVHPIAGQVVHQRTRDAYVDATAMCQAGGEAAQQLPAGRAHQEVREGS